jgi:hypothetical protein
LQRVRYKSGASKKANWDKRFSAVPSGLIAICPDSLLVFQ